MKMIILTLISFGFVACASTKAKITSDTFLIEEKGNGFSSQASVKKNFLKKCAETTKENGYDYFLVQEEEQGEKESYVKAGSAWQKVSKPSRSGMVKLFKEGTQPHNAMNASELLRNLE